MFPFEQIDYQHLHRKEDLNLKFNIIEKIKIKQLAKSISKETGDSADRERKRLSRICRRYGVTAEEYYKEKLYLISERKILNDKTALSQEEEESIMIGKIAKDLGVSEAKAGEIIKHLKEKYGLSNYKIMRRRYYKYSDEKIDTILDFEEKGIGVSAKRNAPELSAEEKQEKRKKADKAKMKMLDRAMNESGLNIKELVGTFKRRRLWFGEMEKNYWTFKHYLKTDEEIETFISQADCEEIIFKKNLHDDAGILTNKLSFSKFFSREMGRACWSNVDDNSLESFKKFAQSAGDSIIVKPLDGLMGEGIRKESMNEEEIESIHERLISGEKVICEQCIQPHPVVASLGGGSVNTVRIVTILENDECNIIYALFKIGGKGVADNLARGGMVTEVDVNSGMIVGKAYDKDGNSFAVDPYTGNTIEGVCIPFWKEVIELSKESAKKIANVKCIGWDIAVTEKGPVLVEGNSAPYLPFIETVYQNEKTGNRYRIEKYLS